MTDYEAPIRDIHFVLYELLKYEHHCGQLSGVEETTPDLVSAIVEEAAKFCQQVLSPLNAVGDQEGCRFENGDVSTPTGFKEAYQQYKEAGWPSMTHAPRYGGQGLPQSLGTVLSEMIGSANWAWAMYPGLSHGAMNTIMAHGSEQQKDVYLQPLISGEWTGTMCLTEPHCGTDLGLLKTRAAPSPDGSYTLSGTKIFISAGEHDLSENIVHIVLAKLPDAPEGTKGISLFIVPKFLPDEQGKPGVRNQVSCGSIEEKMGIHGNATCVLNFDDATGYLIGPANKGLSCMFTFMNMARLGTAIQGLAHSELGFQMSLKYSKERLQMRSLSGAKKPELAADPIIVHPDVRRMLLTQKAFAEGGRMFAYYIALLVDISENGSNDDKKNEAESLLGLLTPIAKAFLTETGFESANLGLQCYGGHGYIREWGMEQNVRDARIAMLYEGTTGIQALDLLGRKVLLNQGETLKVFTKKIHKFCEANREYGDSKIAKWVCELAEHNRQWGDVTMHVGLLAMENPDEVGAAAVDYLMYSGYVCLAYFWAQAAIEAKQSLEKGVSDERFYEAKIMLCEFYFQRILPRTKALEATIKSGSANLMQLPEEDFLF